MAQDTGKEHAAPNIQPLYWEILLLSSYQEMVGHGSDRLTSSGNNHSCRNLRSGLEVYPGCSPWYVIVRCLNLGCSIERITCCALLDNQRLFFDLTSKTFKSSSLFERHHKFLCDLL